MAQPGKVLAAKHDNSFAAPGTTQWMERNDSPSTASYVSLHAYHMTCVPTATPRPPTHR